MNEKYECPNCKHKQEEENNGFCLVCGDNIVALKVESKVAKPAIEKKVVIEEPKIEAKPVKSIKKSTKSKSKKSKSKN